NPSVTDGCFHRPDGACFEIKQAIGIVHCCWRAGENMKDPTASYRRAANVSATAPNPPSRGNAVGLSAAVLSAFLVVAATGSASAQATSGVSPAESASACATPGGWIDVKTGRSIDRVELFRDLVAKSAVVLLGESH